MKSIEEIYDSGNVSNVFIKIGDNPNLVAELNVGMSQDYPQAKLNMEALLPYLSESDTYSYQAKDSKFTIHTTWKRDLNVTVFDNLVEDEDYYHCVLTVDPITHLIKNFHLATNLICKDDQELKIKYDNILARVIGYDLA